MWNVGGDLFPYRFKVTVNSSKVPGNLTDFPLYFPLSLAPAEFHVNAKSDGGDIRVTQGDGSTQQALDLTFYTQGSSIGETHVGASSISSSVDTDFYYYYGNASLSQPAAASTYGKYNVWDSNYKLVWHCQEDPSGGSNAVKDSTSNQIHGTGAASMTSGDLVSGKLEGYGYNFAGAANDWIDTVSNITATADFNNGGTLSCWLNGVTSLLSQPVSLEGYFFIDSISSKFRCGADGGANYRTQVSAPSAGWHLVTIEFDGNNGTSYLYIDNESTVSGSTGTCAVDSASRPFRFGAWSGGSNFRYTGLGDEPRLTVGAYRGRNHHDAMWNNQNDPATFFTVGPEERSALVGLGMINAV